MAIDIYGREYIDCTSQAWSLNVGYQHPRVIAAAKGQIDKLVFASRAWDTVPALLLAKRLAEISPGELKKSFFTSAGSTSVEGAILLAMKYTKAQRILTLYHGYHGRNLITMAASYLGGPKAGLESFMGGFVRVPNFYCYRCYFGMVYPDCDLFCAKFMDRTLEHAADGKIAGVLLEPVQGNGGQIPAPDGYLPEVRKICNDHGVLLIFDEVQTGFGRCGTMFASDYYKTVPDIMVIGKGLSSGFPLSAILTTEAYDVFEPGDFGFTHSGQAVACAAALATIDVLLDERLPENAVKMGNLMKTRLKELANRYDIIGDVRGVGLLIGVELVKDGKRPAVDECTKIRHKMFEKGVICGVSGVGNTGNVIKFKPPLCISEGQVERVVEVFEETLREVK